MKSLFAIFLLTLATVSSAATLPSIQRNAAGRLDADVVNGSLFATAKRIEFFLGRQIVVELEKDRLITLRAKDRTAMQLLEGLAEAAEDLTIEEEAYRIVLRQSDEPVVTMDVKEADVRVILKDMQRQCGVRNLMIDPDVQGKGTFLFNGVPCSVAFQTVFRSLGIAGTVEPNSIVRVER